MGLSSISSIVPFVVAKVAHAHGVDPEPLLRGTGIGADKPPPAEEHIASDRYFAVWRRAVALLGLAKALGMSERTLQRRLADEDTKYNDVVDDVRMEFAKRYLARGTMSASEVAYLVGFTEPPAFFKAFKRWTGMTPREYQLGT